MINITIHCIIHPSGVFSTYICKPVNVHLCNLSPSLPASMNSYDLLSKWRRLYPTQYSSIWLLLHIWDKIILLSVPTDLLLFTSCKNSRMELHLTWPFLYWQFTCFSILSSGNSTWWMSICVPYVKVYLYGIDSWCQIVVLWIFKRFF